VGSPVTGFGPLLKSIWRFFPVIPSPREGLVTDLQWFPRLTPMLRPIVRKVFPSCMTSVDDDDPTSEGDTEFQLPISGRPEGDAANLGGQVLMKVVRARAL